MNIQKHILTYALLATASFLLISLLYYALSMRHHYSGTTELIGKVAYYERNAVNYNLLFLGDSRTYCDISPEQIDSRLGTRSYNLAHWSNWMISQHALYEDLAPKIPRGTTVVWSLGKHSFNDTEVAAKYPFNSSNVVHYLNVGIPPSRLVETLVAFNPLTRFFHKRGTILTHIRELFALPVWSACARTNCTRQASAQPDWYARFAVPGVDRVEVVAHEGRTTSVALHYHSGHYERFEIDRNFFRSQQKKTCTDTTAEAYQLPAPSPGYWQLFLENLDRFQAANVHLIINVLEEAPHGYAHPSIREKWRRFFLDEVAPEAKRRGIPFVYVDFASFTDDDFFDHNHMNKQGTKKYAPLLADALAPLLPSKE
ncbi:MAG: hypothetical protein V3573_13515 [Desulfovibrionaceae bacterium]